MLITENQYYNNELPVMDFVEPYIIQYESEVMMSKMSQAMMIIEHKSIINNDVYLLNEGIKEFFVKAWEWIKGLAEKIKKFFLKAVNWVETFIKKMLGIITSDDIVQAEKNKNCKTLIPWLDPSGMEKISTEDGFKGQVAGFLAAIKGAFSKGVEALGLAVTDNYASKCSAIIDAVYAELIKDINSIKEPKDDEKYEDMIQIIKANGLIQKALSNSVKVEAGKKVEDAVTAWKSGIATGKWKKYVKISSETGKKILDVTMKKIKEANTKVQADDAKNDDDKDKSAKKLQNIMKYVSQMTIVLNGLTSVSMKVISIIGGQCKGCILACAHEKRSKKIENASYDSYFKEDVLDNNSNKQEDEIFEETFLFNI